MDGEGVVIAARLAAVLSYQRQIDFRSIGGLDEDERADWDRFVELLEQAFDEAAQGHDAYELVDDAITAAPCFVHPVDLQELRAIRDSLEVADERQVFAAALAEAGQ